MKSLLLRPDFIASAALVLFLFGSSGSSQEAKKPTGYYAFVDVTEKSMPEKDRHPAYPGSIAGKRGDLHSIASGVDQKGKVIWKVETDWTWTDPPGAIVPGDLVTLRLAYRGGPSTPRDPGRGELSADFADYELAPQYRAVSRFYPNSFLENDGVTFKKGFDGEWSYALTNLGIRKSEGVFLPEHAVDYIGKVGRYQNVAKRPGVPGEWISLRVGVYAANIYWRVYYYNYKWVDGPPPKDTIKIPPIDSTKTIPENPTDPTKLPPVVNEPVNTNKFTVQAGVRRAKPGELVQVPVYLLNPSGVANLNATIGYSTTIATAEGKPLRGNVLGTSLFESNATEAGIARVGIAGSKPLADSGILAHISFKAVGKPGERTVLKVAVPTANGVDGKAMTAETIDGEVIIVGEGGKVLGDCDGDGVITASDALCALKMSVKLVTEDKNLDMDKDGSVTSNDARLILMKAVGK